ncbi:MAG: hypothetical protein QJR07_04705 [Acetobacteraceae bacterium]|uniref:hypothetical protein n=1 Tax=Rubritepida flocculans TaxID=182403 RepID=UPI0012EC7BCD|nr:hypothetical protein [Rubritepida flocculans]MDI3306383.1 hypothetical protein [Acetobacteraceae bacterium]
MRDSPRRHEDHAKTIAEADSAPRLYAVFMRPPPLSHGAFTRSPPTERGLRPSLLESAMLDVILLVLGLGFFGLMAAYTVGCERV